MNSEWLNVLDRDGVLHLRDFFSPEETRQLLHEAETVMRDETQMCPRDDAFYARYQSDNVTFVDRHQGELLRNLVDGPRLKHIADVLFPSGSIFHMSLIQLSEPGRQQGISWHQDVDPEVHPDAMCNFLIYPEDLSLDAGPLVFVPGSHRAGLLPSGESYAPLPGQQTLLACAGDLVILKATVFHCVPRNRTNRRRFSINIRFRDVRVRREELCVGVYRNGKFDYSKGSPVPAR